MLELHDLPLGDRINGFITTITAFSVVTPSQLHEKLGLIGQPFSRTGMR